MQNILYYIFQYVYPIIILFATFALNIYLIQNKEIKIFNVGLQIMLLLYIHYHVDFIENFPLLTLLSLIFTFFNLCIYHKKNDKALSYIFWFNILLLLFTYFITVFFGKYYTTLQDSATIYADQLNLIDQIINEYSIFLLPIITFRCNNIYFTIGLEQYFTPIESISLTDIHFIQKIFAYLIPCLFVTNFTLITPELKNSKYKSETVSTDIFELSNYKMYSVGLRNLLTNKIYKELNTSFYFKFTIKNITKTQQTLNLNIDILNSNNLCVIHKCFEKNIEADISIPYTINITPKEFENLQEDNYKIRICINNDAEFVTNFIIAIK